MEKKPVFKPEWVPMAYGDETKITNVIYKDRHNQPVIRQLANKPLRTINRYGIKKPCLKGR